MQIKNIILGTVFAITAAGFIACGEEEQTEETATEESTQTDDTTEASSEEEATESGQ